MRVYAKQNVIISFDINIPRDYPRGVEVNMWRSSFRSHIPELPLTFSKLDDMSFYDFGPVDQLE